MIIAQITFTSDDRIWGAKKTLDKPLSLASFEELVAVVRAEMFKGQSITDGEQKGKRSQPQANNKTDSHRGEHTNGAKPGTGDYVFVKVSISEKEYQGEVIRAAYLYTKDAPWNRKGVWIPPDKWDDFLEATGIEIADFPPGSYAIDETTLPTCTVAKSERNGKIYIARVYTMEPENEE